MITHYTYIPSPIGDLLLVGSAEGLAFVGFPEGSGRLDPAPEWIEDASSFPQASAQFAEYFAGTRHAFALKLAPKGTAFQNNVWQALLRIPYGETTSYAEIARRIGKPSAVRAVGAANGKNPLPIVIPCHRVIGSNGSLTGFGGGLPAKEFLLRLEGSLS
ncbi:MAG: methylated-DNA--[protein]-cysteine S-methyltransferase [Rhodospirillales bacterium]|nr:methylated-DNA--[protein]-cysteine S-methyltransferase [Rhodospirillales bacterium]